MKKYRVQIDYDDSFDEEIVANSEEEAEDIAMDKYESQKGYPDITITLIEDHVEEEEDGEYSSILDEYENGEPNGEPMENQIQITECPYAVKLYNIKDHTTEIGLSDVW